MTTVVTRGAASAQALGYASSSAAVNYVEDVFSTYLYTGNGSTQTITNGIDLSGKGGLVWLKRRGAIDNHFLWDTARGAAYGIIANNAGAQGNYGSAGLSAFNSTGFSLGSYDPTNGSTAGNTYASWTFREQPKFFDVVTYTGDGVAGRSIAHNLGSTPGCIIVKCTSSGSTDWQVYHIGLGAMPTRIVLNSTNAADSLDHFYATPTSSVFYVNNYASVNQNAATYVAYLFAHNAGGFGLTGTDNVISCGSLTMGAGITTATLGYEPQWLLIKGSNNANEWWLIDNMRGLSQVNYARLFANSSAAESVASGPYILPTATGFTMDGSIFGSGNSFIYIAIRRGPMKVPTSGTTVFLPQIRTGTGAAATVSNVGFAPDLIIGRNRPVTYGVSWAWMDKLRGNTVWLDSSNAGQDGSTTVSVTAFENTGASYGVDNITTCFNYTGASVEQFYFQRAPGFFDEVCYTGTGSATTFTHNLGVVPELMIVKERNGANGWQVYSASLTNTEYLILNTSAGVPASSATRWNSTTPTSTVFSVGTHGATNGSGQNFVNYLFATCAGVSKVGSYTGTGTTLQIDCGFTAGARFVLIKRTDSTGDWYVWDSARGIVAGNDPYLLLNSTAAEVTGTDYVDTAASGFEISSTAPAAINANGGSFIFLAIA